MFEFDGKCIQFPPIQDIPYGKVLDKLMEDPEFKDLYKSIKEFKRMVERGNPKWSDPEGWATVVWDRANIALEAVIEGVISERHAFCLMMAIYASISETENSEDPAVAA